MPIVTFTCPKSATVQREARTSINPRRQPTNGFACTSIHPSILPLHHPLDRCCCSSSRMPIQYPITNTQCPVALHGPKKQVVILSSNLESINAIVNHPVWGPPCQPSDTLLLRECPHTRARWVPPLLHKGPCARGEAERHSSSWFSHK